MLGKIRLATLGLLVVLGALCGLLLHQQTAASTQPVAPPVGERLFTEDCATCHGLGGNGGGGAPILDNGLPVRDYPTTRQLAAFIHSNMPATAPKSLTMAEAVRLARYVESLDHTEANP